MPIDRLRRAVAAVAKLTRGRVRTGVSHDDADDDLGTIVTDDAIGFNPFPLLRALHQSGVKVVVIGQVAGIMHGSQELTGDLDLLWDGDRYDAGRMAAAFASVGATVTDDDGRPLLCDSNAFGLPKVQFRTEAASGDCCTPALPWGALRVADFAARCCVATDPDGFQVRYLTRADLITMRRAVGRPKDLRRAAELEEIDVTAVPLS